VEKKLSLALVHGLAMLMLDRQVPANEARIGQAICLPRNVGAAQTLKIERLFQTPLSFTRTSV